MTSNSCIKYIMKSEHVRLVMQGCWQVAGPVMLLRFAACVLLAACGAHAVLHEDQKGSNSWHISRIGAPRAGHVLRRTPACLLSTQADVLASLSLRDGAVQWRKRQAVHQLLVIESRDTAVTSDAESLSAWSLQSGQLLWSSAESTAALCAGTHSVYSVSDRSVASWALDTGRKGWSTAISSSAGWCRVQHNQVHVLTWSAGSTTIRAQSLSVSDGSLQTENAAECAYELSSKPATRSSPVLAVLSRDGQGVCSVAPSQSAAQCTCAALPAGGRGQAVSATTAHVAVRSTGSKLHIFSAAEGALQLVATLDNVAAASDVFTEGERTFVAVARPVSSEQPGKLQLLVYDAASGAEEAQETVAGPTDADANGAVSQPGQLWAVRATSATSAPFFRCCIAC